MEELYYAVISEVKIHFQSLAKAIEKNKTGT